MTIPANNRILIPPGVDMGQERRAQDAFSNPAARTGYGTNNLVEQTQFPLTRMTQQYQTLTSLYRDNWIVQNIIDAIPDDMLKNWIAIRSQVDPDHINQINRVVRQIGLRAQLLKGMKWGRLYGGAAGVILIDGDQDRMSEPLDYAQVLPGTFKGLYIIDRWTGIYPTDQLISDIGQPDYGLPEFYTLNDVSGRSTKTIHHSRVIRFTGRLLPLWECIAEMYWGASEIEGIYSEIKRRENVAANICSLTFQANVWVQDIEGLDQLFALGGGAAQARFWQTMQAQSELRSSLGTQLVEKGTTLQNRSYSFTGLAEVYVNTMCDVAGAARIPVSKLFGRSATGLNSTGEGDLQNYYDMIEKEQESRLRPILDRILPLLAVSTWGEIPNDLDYSFPPIAAANEIENSAIVEKESTAIRAMFTTGLIDQATALKELQELSKRTGVFTDITDEMVAAGVGVWAWDIADKMSLGAMPTIGAYPASMPDEDNAGA